jgi:hypothetical protein
MTALQPVEKKRPGTSGGKPPRDPAKGPAVPDSAALRAIAAAHDTKAAPAPLPIGSRGASALERPTTAATVRSNSRGGGLIPALPTSGGGNYSSAASYAGDAASVSEAPTMPTPLMCAPCGGLTVWCPAGGVPLVQCGGQSRLWPVSHFEGLTRPPLAWHVALAPVAIARLTDCTAMAAPGTCVSAGLRARGA